METTNMRSFPERQILSIRAAKPTGFPTAARSLPVAAPKVRPLVILPLFDHLPPDRAGAGE